MRLSRLALTLSVAVVPAIARADTYSIFSPRPRESMREMSTDRPDTTESPISIDAGHVQVELDLVALGFDRARGMQPTTVDVVPANLKVGLTDRVDLQLVIEPHHRERIDLGTTEMTTSGYGGTTVRVKANLWGNDGGKTAAALLPFVGRSGGAWSAGLAVPVGFELPGGFEAAVMPEVLVDAIGEGSDVTGMLTATTGHDLVGPVGAYGEVVGQVTGTSTDAVAMQADGGITVGVTDNVKFDGGVRVGVFGEVPDLEAFVGFAARH